MNTNWSDTDLMKKIKNPNTNRQYTIKINTGEITMIGVHNQPDFASIEIEFIPRKYIIELKSLKLYFLQFRNKILSYERLSNIIYDDIKNIYNPIFLKLTMTFNPRGGISSTIII